MTTSRSRHRTPNARRVSVRSAVAGACWLLAAAIVAACAGPSAGPGANDTAPSWCGDLALSRSGGHPGDTIVVNGVPTTVEALYAAIIVNGDAHHPVLVDRPGDGDDGPLVLTVPFHPDGRNAGGRVDLEFGTEEGTTCRGVSLDVRRLPEANDPAVSGSFQRLVDELQAELEAAAATRGVEPASLRGELDELPLAALPLGLAQFVLDHPGNPESLANVLASGTFPGLDGNLDTALLDQLIHVRMAAAASRANAGPQSRSVHNSDIARCLEDRAMTSGEHLDDCMRLQRSRAAWSERAGIVSDLLNVASAIALANPLPGDEVAIGILTSASVVAGIGLYLESQMLPSQVNSLEFDVTRDRFDALGQTGTWVNVRVTVSDTEVDLVKIVGEVVAALPIKRLSKWLASFFPDRVEKVVETKLKVEARLVKALAERYDNRLQWRIPYSILGAVDITTYTDSYESSVRGDRVIAIGAHEDRDYAPTTPLTAGTASLALALRSGFFNDSLRVASQSIVVVEPPDARFVFSWGNAQHPYDVVARVCCVETGTFETVYFEEHFDSIGTWGFEEQPVPVEGTLSIGPGQATRWNLSSAIDTNTLTGSANEVRFDVAGSNSANAYESAVQARSYAVRVSSRRSVFSQLDLQTATSISFGIDAASGHAEDTPSRPGQPLMPDGKARVGSVADLTVVVTDTQSALIVTGHLRADWVGSVDPNATHLLPPGRYTVRITHQVATESSYQCARNAQTCPTASVSSPFQHQAWFRIEDAPTAARSD